MVSRRSIHRLECTDALLPVLVVFVAVSRALSFREQPVPEAQLPRMLLPGSSLNKLARIRPRYRRALQAGAQRGNIEVVRDDRIKEKEYMGRQSSSQDKGEQDKGEGAPDKAKSKAKEAIGAVTGEKEKKSEGALDKAKGRAKEATGAVTGDEEKKVEGRSDQTKGTAKDKLGKAKDLLK